jgi:hypothetical protein
MASHLNRAECFLGLFEKHHIVQKRQGVMLLGLETGWVHRDSRLLRQFHDVQPTLYQFWEGQ